MRRPPPPARCPPSLPLVVLGGARRHLPLRPTHVSAAPTVVRRSPSAPPSRGTVQAPRRPTSPPSSPRAGDGLCARDLPARAAGGRALSRRLLLEQHRTIADYGPSPAAARDAAPLRPRSVPRVRRGEACAGARACVRGDRRLPDAREAAGRASDARRPHRVRRGGDGHAWPRARGHGARRSAMPGTSTGVALRSVSVSKRARPTSSSRRTSALIGRPVASGLPAPRREDRLSPRPAAARRADPVRHPHRPVHPSGGHLALLLSIRWHHRRPAVHHDVRRMRRFLQPGAADPGRGIVARVHRAGGSRAPVRLAGTSRSARSCQPPQHVSVSRAGVDALRRGDLAAAFGQHLRGQGARSVAPPPSGRMRLVHRIVSLGLAGGSSGLGEVVGEADVTPDEPGT